MFKNSKPNNYILEIQLLLKHNHLKESKNVIFGVTDVMYDALEVKFDVDDVIFDPIPRQI